MKNNSGINSRYIFRGKHIPTGKWVYGNYVYKQSEDDFYQPKHHIKELSKNNYTFEIDVKTLEQCKGENNEGDLVFENI